MLFYLIAGKPYQNTLAKFDIRISPSCDLRISLGHQHVRNKRTGYRNNSSTFSFLASFWVPLKMPMVTLGSCCHCLEIFAHYLFFKSRTFFSFKNKWLFLRFNSQISGVSRNREEALCCASKALKWGLILMGNTTLPFPVYLLPPRGFLASITASHKQILTGKASLKSGQEVFPLAVHFFLLCWEDFKPGCA